MIMIIGEDKTQLLIFQNLKFTLMSENFANFANGPLICENKFPPKKFNFFVDSQFA